MKKQLSTIPHIISPQERELLLRYVTKQSREASFLNPHHAMTLRQRLVFWWLCLRKKTGVPLAYLTKEKEFYSRSFFVNKHVLIPRPESELLIDCVLHAYKKGAKNNAIVFYDIGTGSGNLITTLACEIPSKHATFIASDVSQRALHVAKHNAQTLCPKTPIRFYHAEFLQSAPLRQKIITTSRQKPSPHLMVIANLPYVTTQWKKHLMRQKNSYGLRFEPQRALWSADGGLMHYKTFFNQLKTLLPQTSFHTVTIFYEINDHQATPLITFLKEQMPHSRFSVHKDLAGHRRVIVQKITRS